MRICALAAMLWSWVSPGIEPHDGIGLAALLGGWVVATAAGLFTGILPRYREDVPAAPALARAEAEAAENRGDLQSPA